MIRHGTAICFLAAMAVAQARAEPSVTEKIEYYDVTGGTPKEVRAEIDRLGPVSKVEGKHYAGLTVGHTWWRYAYRKTSQGCVIASVSLRVEVNITMPRLISGPGTPLALSQTFASYTDKLLAHERGHGKIRIDTAKRIEDGIGRLPTEVACDALGKAANALGERLLAEERQLNVDYDATTQHGRAQGARFP
jgi:predicted secreted Zn-dependent protease